MAGLLIAESFLIVPAVLLFGGGLIVAQIATARFFWDDYRAGYWPEVPGVIRSAQVVQRQIRGDDGLETIFEPDLKYEYRVNGQLLVGSQYELRPANDHKRENADAIVAAHPPGRQVAVYYDPDDPGTAVLNNQFGLTHYFVPLMLIPWDAFLFGFIIWIARAIRRKRRGPPPHGAHIVRDEAGQRAIVSEQNAIVSILLWIGLLPLAIIVVASILGWPLGWIGVARTDEVAVRLFQIGWVGYIATLAVLYFRRRIEIRNGVCDVLIDDVNRLLQLPKRRGHARPEWVSCRWLLSVLHSTRIEDSEDRDTIHETIVGYQVDKDRCELCVVADFYVRADAVAFRDWLAEQVGVA